MLINKRFINNKKVFLSLIISIFYINNASCQMIFYKEDGEECKFNLHCGSGCCKSGKCSETKKCTSLVNNIYAYQAITSAGLVIIFSIYLFLKLRCMKKELEEKKKKH